MGGSKRHAVTLLALALGAGCIAVAGIEDLALDPGLNGTGGAGAGAGGGGGDADGGGGSGEPSGDGELEGSLEGGELECVCDDGYVDLDGGCDYDECAAGEDDCDDNATCNNIAGSFECQCNFGYKGSGKTCEIDPNTYVLDISPRTVEIVVEGIGTFQVSQLSRLGWDIEVIDEPQVGDIKPKSPGAVTFLPWRVREISGEPSEIKELKAWAADEIAESGSPRDVEVTLEGRDQEVLGVFLRAASPTEGDLTVTQMVGEPDDVLAELLFEFPASEVSFLGFPTESEPQYAKRLEIGGKQATVSDWDASGDLERGDGSNDAPVTFTRAPGPNNFLGIALWGILDDPTARWEVSVVVIDNDDPVTPEKLRIDCFGAWPASVTFFNVLKDYGTEFLTDATFVVSHCQDT